MKLPINTICGHDKVKVDPCVIKWFCKSMQSHSDSNECIRRHEQKVRHIRTLYIFGKVIFHILQQHFYVNKTAED